MIVCTKKEIILALALFWAAVVVSLFCLVGGCYTWQPGDPTAADIHDACTVKGPAD